MRAIAKDIQITVDGTSRGFRLTRAQAFSDTALLGMLIRRRGENKPGLLTQSGLKNGRRFTPGCRYNSRSR